MSKHSTRPEDQGVTEQRYKLEAHGQSDFSLIHPTLADTEAMIADSEVLKDAFSSPHKAREFLIAMRQLVPTKLVVS